MINGNQYADDFSVVWRSDQFGENLRRRRLGYYEALSSAVVISATPNT